MTNPTIQINLNLSRYCIETAIRRRYNRSLSRFFNQKAPDRDLESEIDLLKTALTSFDFPFLRNTWPELAGHGTAAVTLTRNRRRPIPAPARGAGSGRQGSLRKAGLPLFPNQKYANSG